MNNITVNEINPGDYIYGEFIYGKNNKGFYKCLVKNVLSDYKPIKNDIDVPTQQVLESEKSVTVNGINNKTDFLGANELVKMRKMTDEEIYEFNKLFE